MNCSSNAGNSDIRISGKCIMPCVIMMTIKCESEEAFSTVTPLASKNTLTGKTLNTRPIQICRMIIKLYVPIEVSKFALRVS